MEGRRVRVLWANEAAYFSGVVQGRGTGKDEGKHVIEYDDGDVMVHDLSAETVQLEPYDPDAAEKSPASSEEMETSSGGGAGGKVEPKQELLPWGFPEVEWVTKLVVDRARGHGHCETRRRGCLRGSFAPDQWKVQPPDSPIQVQEGGRHTVVGEGVYTQKNKCPVGCCCF